MFDEINEEKKLKQELKKLTEGIEVEKSIYYRAIARYESSLKEKKRFTPLFKIIIPVTLSFLLIFLSVFPVFGNNGTLIDILNTQRINRSISSLKNISASQTENKSNSAVDSTIIQTILEKEFGLDPQKIYKLGAQNADYAETVAIVVIANLTNAEPENIVEMRRNNYGWGIIIRKRGVDLNTAMLKLEQIRRKLESREKNILIRGEVEAISDNTNSITINTFPFKIYLGEDTEVEGTIEEGKSLEIEASYIIPSNFVKALKVRELNPNAIGIQTFIGQVVSINENSLTLLLKDGNQKELIFTPQTLLIPPHIPLIPGRIVRCDSIADGEKLILVRIVQRRPLLLRSPHSFPPQNTIKRR